ncbi:MAG: SDR family oxidoreductase [Alphaproteobacteria bacterium]
MRLEGKSAIVTGAGSGIGKATACRFAEEGAIVICADLNREGNEATVTDNRAAGGRAEAVEADVTRDEDVANLIARSVSAVERVDILINNAGQAVIGTVEEVSSEDWDRQLDVNLKSIYRASKAIWPHFKAEGGGIILNTASIAGLIGIPGQVSYGVSKAGAVMITKCMALDGAKHNIRVNCVCPGWVPTPMVEYHKSQLDDPEAFQSRLERLHPLGLGEPAHIAAGFVFLASDEARWITGIALPIDGGLTCGIAAD